MGRDAFMRALEVLKSDRGMPHMQSEPYVEPAAEELWQSCFGVPGARDNAADPCRTCPQVDACSTISALVLRSVHLTTGTTDPIAARKRASGRARTAKHRASKRASLAATSAAASSREALPA